MCRINERRWLLAVALLAALIAYPLALRAQPPAQAPEATPQTQPSPAPVPLTPEQIGDTLVARQRYQAAIAAYNKEPNKSADVWNKMGIAYQMMFNSNDASRCYQASLKLNPRNAHVLNNMGTVYDSLKEYRSAERMYRKALKIDPQSAIVYKNLGTNLLAQHKYKQGWAAYQTALGLDPKIFEDRSSPRMENPSSTQQRGAMNYFMAKGCVSAGMPDRAIEYLRMALNEGFITPKKLAADKEFVSLRDLPAFQQLIAAQSAP
jgi:Tfp pilus assembly protein PilF